MHWCLTVDIHTFNIRKKNKKIQNIFPKKNTIFVKFSSEFFTFSNLFCFGVFGPELANSTLKVSSWCTIEFVVIR